jgi:hypothetical protein
MEKRKKACFGKPFLLKACGFRLAYQLFLGYKKKLQKE